MPTANASLVRAGLVAVAWWLATPAHAQNDAGFDLDRTPRDCVVLSDIDKTEVTDDRTILFYMRSRRVYRNYLPRRCPNLERENRFSYETRGGRLCSSDTITVLEQWGGRLSQGFTCRLGQFQEISIEEAEAITAEADAVVGRGRIEARPAEVPPANDDERAAAADAEDAAAAAEDSEQRPRRRERRRSR